MSFIRLPDHLPGLLGENIGTQIILCAYTVMLGAFHLQIRAKIK